MTELNPTLKRFFDAVDAQDPEAAGACFAPNAKYHFLMPHPAAVGRDAIIDALRASVGGADWVRWDVVHHVQAGDIAFVERVDHFGFGHRAVSIECVGVFHLDGDHIVEVRDYADLGTWRERKEAARTALA